jgi:hypothetical protein
LSVADKRRFYEAPAQGSKRSAPSALRNREPIAEVLRDWLPSEGLVLEIASGTGEHAAHFAQAFPALVWQPSDVEALALASIEDWRRESALDNLLAPITLDAAADWPIHAADAVLSINMVHISPWVSALGLIANSARILPRGGPLILYGPWKKAGVETAPSNLAFDSDLKRRNPDWGLRLVEDFAAEAEGAGLTLEDQREMPANNLMLLFRKL